MLIGNRVWEEGPKGGKQYTLACRHCYRSHRSCSLLCLLSSGSTAHSETWRKSICKTKPARKISHSRLKKEVNGQEEQGETKVLHDTAGGVPCYPIIYCSWVKPFLIELPQKFWDPASVELTSSFPVCPGWGHMGTRTNYEGGEPDSGPNLALSAVMPTWIGHDSTLGFICKWEDGFISS